MVLEMRVIIMLLTKEILFLCIALGTRTCAACMFKTILYSFFCCGMLFQFSLIRNNAFQYQCKISEEIV